MGWHVKVGEVSNLSKILIGKSEKHPTQVMKVQMEDTEITGGWRRLHGCILG
jgi:hypothetical protein